MKKILSFLVVMIMILSSFNVVADDYIEVIVDAQTIEFKDQQPIMMNDRVLVPLRAIFEALGARVYYDDATKLITAKRNLTTIKLTVGSDKLYINGEETIIDVPAFVQNGRTLVPVRAVSEALGVTVDWDDESKCVIITSLFWEHYVNIEKIVESYKHNSKDVTIECYYPQLRSKKDKIIAFNKQLKKDAEAYVEGVKKTVDNYDENKLNFVCDFLITYDYADLFSYITIQTVNDSEEFQKSYNYSISPITEIGLSAIYNTEFEELNLDYNSVFNKHIDQAPNLFLDTAKDTLNSKDGIVGFYLNFSGFSYFVNPGILTPKELGIITIDIEY